MENFVDELKQLSNTQHLTPITHEEDMAWIAYTSPEERELEHRTHVPLNISPDRFIKALFVDPSKVAEPSRLLTEMHTIASDMQDVELNVSLYDIFTPEELEAVYNKPARCAISLWQRIETEADAAINRGGTGADLRFGHDSNLYRLMTLMGINLRGEDYNYMDEILPMAANLQMIFYRNQQGDVVVQLLHNEKSIGFKSWQESSKRSHPLL